MAKTKAKTVTVRVGVLYDGRGHFSVGGVWVKGKHPSDTQLLGDAGDAAGWSECNLPHTCLVDIELLIPEPVKGKVLNVKAVKP